ncbi:MAG TPA: hypothetical protein DCE41_10085 [Cytophagales bacterium]|nr:hypothetical protein [Cytophagales bacterium]HAA22091.1 hypothetical protein [Cytophagales bacterium]HAP59509.1 hypothetical protein [Cytophagales bacterium]
MIKKATILPLSSEIAYIRFTLWRLSRLGLWVTVSVLLVDFLTDFLFSKPLWPQGLGTYRLMVVIVFVFITFLASKHLPHRLVSSLLLLGILLGFLLYPGIYPAENPGEHILLMLFLSVLISVLPYLIFIYGKDNAWIIGWEVIIVNAFMWSSTRVIPAVPQSPYAGLPQSLLERPMVMVGYIGVFIFIQMIVIQFKRTHHQQRMELQQQQWELHKSLDLTQEQNQELQAQKEQLHVIDQHLQKAQEDLEEKVQERSHALEDQNRVLLQYNYMYVHLMRAPIARIKGLLQLAKLEQDPEKQAEVRQVLEKEFQQLNQVVSSVSNLLNEQNDPLHQTVIARIQAEYQSSDPLPEWMQPRT